MPGLPQKTSLQLALPGTITEVLAKEWHCGGSWGHKPHQGSRECGLEETQMSTPTHHCCVKQSQLHSLRNTQHGSQERGRLLGFLGGSDGKRIHLQGRRPGFDPGVGKIPWERKWLPTPVFLPGESHGQRSLEGHSPWDHKETDTTEQLTLSLAVFGNPDPNAGQHMKIKKLVLTLTNLKDTGPTHFWAVSHPANTQACC